MSQAAHENKPYWIQLMKMSNQITSFFATQRGQTPEEATAEHIRKFWDPRMRKAIIAHLDQGGEGLNPIARGAIMILKNDH